MHDLLNIARQKASGIYRPLPASTHPSPRLSPCLSLGRPAGGGGQGSHRGVARKARTHPPAAAAPPGRRPRADDAAPPDNRLGRPGRLTRWTTRTASRARLGRSRRPGVEGRLQRGACNAQVRTVCTGRGGVGLAGGGGGGPGAGESAARGVGGGSRRGGGAVGRHHPNWHHQTGTTLAGLER